MPLAHRRTPRRSQGRSRSGRATRPPRARACRRSDRSRSRGAVHAHGLPRAPPHGCFGVGDAVVQRRRGVAPRRGRGRSRPPRGSRRRSPSRSSRRPGGCRAPRRRPTGGGGRPRRSRCGSPRSESGASNAGPLKTIRSLPARTYRSTSTGSVGPPPFAAVRALEVGVLDERDRRVAPPSACTVLRDASEQRVSPRSTSATLGGRRHGRRLGAAAVRRPDWRRSGAQPGRRRRPRATASRWGLVGSVRRTVIASATSFP